MSRRSVQALLLALILLSEASAKKLTPIAKARLAKLEADAALEKQLIEENEDAVVKSLGGALIKDLIGPEGQVRSKNYFVKYYTPWCGHCKKMAPEFEMLAEVVDAESYRDAQGRTGKYSDVTVAQINCDDWRDACVEDSSIQGFPTLKLYKKDGSVVDYDGTRVTDEMLAFLDRELELV